MAEAVMRILQVEDDANEVFFFQWVVRRWKLPVVAHVAAMAHEAIEYLDALGDDTSQGPDLMLLDINLPRMNGLELLQILKRRDTFRAVPKVMFSNSGHPLDIKRARELGADSYIVKPNDALSFADALRKLHGCWERKECPRFWPDDGSIIPVGQPYSRPAANDA